MGLPTYKADSVHFITECMTLAGVLHVPGAERLFRDYIVPYRESHRRQRERMRKIALKVTNPKQAVADLRADMGGLARKAEAVSLNKKTIQEAVRQLSDIDSELVEIENDAGSFALGIELLIPELKTVRDAVRKRLAEAREKRGRVQL